MASEDDFIDSLFNPEAFPDEPSGGGPTKKAKFDHGEEEAKKASATSVQDAAASCQDFHNALLYSVAFTSDHQVGGGKLLSPSPAAVQLTFGANAPVAQGAAMANTFFNSTYDDPPNLFIKPDWINDFLNPPRSEPISHTKNTNVIADVTFSFIVAGAQVTVTRIEGVGRGAVAGLSFDQVVNVPVAVGGMVTINVTSTATLPNRVSVVTDTIDWWLTINGVRELAGASGPHDVLLTFGPPLGLMGWNGGFDLNGAAQFITEARLRFAIAAVNSERGNVQGFSDAVEKHHVDAVFLHLTTLGVDYSLGYRWSGGALNLTYLTDAAAASPGLHHYLWLCATHDARGECHVIAAAFILVCQILGVAAQFELGFMFPWPSRLDDPANGYPKRNNDAAPHMARNAARPYAGPAQVYQPSIKGKFSVDFSNRYYRRTDRAANDGNLPAQACSFVDGAGNTNNFEGAARYNGVHLYAIGDVILDTEANSDLNTCVYYTHHVRNGASRKITLVHTNGKFGLVFGRTDNWALDATPYRQNDGNDAFPYTVAVVNGAAGTATFYWQN
jgi:hypothetical protein